MAEVAKLDAAAHPSFDRAQGAFKIGIRQYLERLMVMGGGDVSTQTAARFAAVGTLGFCVDYAVFEALIALGLSLLAAQVSSFLGAMIVNYALNSRWTFSHYPARSAEAEWRICGRFVTISLMALFLRAGILQLALEVWNWPQGAAAFFGIATGALVNYLGSAFYVFPAVSQRISPSIRWRIAAVGVALYAVLLRLVYMRTLNLIPEEAYYWNYSQHLDFGYLDHPPMIAWLIWLSTHTFGGSEFAVRASALLMWFVTVAFCFQLTRNLYGKTAAFVSILLLSSIPFYFATGFLMMPDAPLLAAWAGVTFLPRAGVFRWKPNSVVRRRYLSGIGLGIEVLDRASWSSDRAIHADRPKVSRLVSPTLALCRRSTGTRDLFACDCLECDPWLGFVPLPERATRPGAFSILATPPASFDCGHPDARGTDLSVAGTFARGDLVNSPISCRWRSPMAVRRYLHRCPAVGLHHI